MSLKEMRETLREMRKESVKPVSRMKKGDISAEIERMKAHREETPRMAILPSAPLSKSKASVESIKEAKRDEFPVKPVKDEKASKKMPVKKEAPKAPAPAPKKKMSKAHLREMLECMSSDEEC